MKLLLAAVRDPFGLLLSGATGVASAILGLPPPLAILTAICVLAVKLGAVPLIDRIARQPRVVLDAAEMGWMERADRAVAAFRQLARSARSEPIGERCMVIGDQARATLQLLRRVAGQSSTVGRMLQSIDGTRLLAEESRLSKEIRNAESAAARHEIELSLGLVQEQLAARRRLEQGRAALLARVQSGVLALEGLVTRLAEVVALGQSTAGPEGAGDRVAELADELEGLRSGLSELDQTNAKRWQIQALSENPIQKFKEE